MEHLINLNFAPGGLPATVHVSQYDDTIRQLRFQLWFGRSKVEVPSGASVRVDIKKPDGHIVLVNGTVNSSDRSIVTVPTTKQMTAVPGGARGTLVVSSTGDKRISSAIFILQVHRDPVEDGDASDSDLSMLQDAIDQTAANASAAAASAAEAQEAAESFTTDTTLSVTGKAADAKKTGDEISAIKAGLSDFKAPGGADKYFKNVKVYGSPANIGISNIRNSYGPAGSQQTGFAIFPATTDAEWGSAIKNRSIMRRTLALVHMSTPPPRGRKPPHAIPLPSPKKRDSAHVIKASCFSKNAIAEDVYGTVKLKGYTPITYALSSLSGTNNGITYTQNTDGTISVQGTATAAAIISPQDENSGALTFSLASGKAYRLRGCPAGGANETYRLEIRDALTSGTTLCIDTGNGVIFTVPESGSYYPIIRIASGQTVDLTFAIEIAEQTNTEETDVLTAIDLVARAGIEKSDAYLSLVADFIPGTTQTYVLLDGVVSQIIHKKSGIAFRTDTYTYGTGTITENRSLSTGESLTITTNLETLMTSIAYSEI